MEIQLVGPGKIAGTIAGKFNRARRANGFLILKYPQVAADSGQVAIVTGFLPAIVPGLPVK